MNQASLSFKNNQGFNASYYETQQSDSLIGYIQTISTKAEIAPSLDLDSKRNQIGKYLPKFLLGNKLNVEMPTQGIKHHSVDLPLSINEV